MKQLPSRVTLAAIGILALASAACSGGVSTATGQPGTTTGVTTGEATAIVSTSGGGTDAATVQIGPDGATLPGVTAGPDGVQVQIPATDQGGNSAGPARPEDKTTGSGSSCQGDQTITANSSRVELRGHCGRVTIQAFAARVSLESADEVVINGKSCVVEAKKLGKITISQDANRVSVSESIGDVTVVGNSNVVEADSITGTVKNSCTANRISS